MMQLLDSTCERLRNVLQDIAIHIQIESKFCISHPKYKSLQLPSEVVSRLQQLPVERQNHYLSLQLRNFMYGIYYNGSLEKTFASDSISTMSFDLNMEDNAVRVQCLKFYERLHQSNYGQGYFDSDWRVLRQENNDRFTVQKNSLTLQVKRDRHLQSTAITGDTVAIKMPRNLIEPGFYVAVGNAGLPQRKSSEDCPNVQIYFNVSPEGAIALTRAITQQLNQICIPFTFKVLANLFEYGRYDSCILCIERDNYGVVQPVLQSIYAENQSHFQVQVPLFTKQLMPGLSLAEEPDYKFIVKEDFGKNRCQILANGLTEVWQQGNETIQNRMASICKQFSLLGISLKSPYLNAKSEDIYTWLN